MNQREWIVYFETVNGRKPTPEEYKDYTKQLRKKKFLKISVVVLPLFVFTVLGFFLLYNRGSEQSVSRKQSETNLPTFGQSGSSKQSQISEESEDKKQIEGTVEDFQTVIDNYKKVLADKRVGYLQYVNLEAVTSTVSTPEVYYSLYDFNKDGKNELIIAGKEADNLLDENASTFERMNNHWNRIIYGVFTLDNGEIVENIMGSGYRSQTFPMVDGSFWVRSSGSAYIGAYTHYDFNRQGSKIEKVLEIYYDNENPADKKIEDDSDDGRSYTQVELMNTINAYKLLEVHQLKWNRIG